MRSLRAHEIVASVVGWSHDYVMCSQRFERVFDDGTWKVWAVAVEGNGAPLFISCEVRKHRSEACGKAFTFLRDYACFVACQLRQFLYVGIRAHDGNLHVLQRPRQCKRVVKKTAIESSDSIGREAWNQAGFDRTWFRRFCHDDQHALTCRRTHDAFARRFHRLLGIIYDAREAAQPGLASVGILEADPKPITTLREQRDRAELEETK